MFIKPKLIIAAAGAGKSTHLIDLIEEAPDDKILVTTYTDSNTLELEQKVLERFGYLPSNLSIMPWFSFLLRDGVRPYQGKIVKTRIANMHFVGMNRSGIIKTADGRTIQIPERKREHYFSPSGHIYSDKLAKFSCKIDDFHQGASIDRICKLYNHIFVDEIQDLNGYDLVFLHKLAKKCKHFVMVGDVRQVAYITHPDSKYKKYQNGRIKEFFLNECKDVDFEIDETSLSISHRCCRQICDIANKVYPELPPCTSGNLKVTGHDGVFFVHKDEVNAYQAAFHPQTLRYKSSKDYADGSINIGSAKGRAYEHVLLAPTVDMLKWFFNHESPMSDEARAKLYIALTRARQSVGVVVSSSMLLKHRDLPYRLWQAGELNLTY